MKRGGGGGRVTVALREGMKAVPLVADPEGIHVVYEDDDLLAVSKPSGIISAPKHRFEARCPLPPSQRTR